MTQYYTRVALASAGLMALLPLGALQVGKLANIPVPNVAVRRPG